MAGKKKHAERSRRSHKQDEGMRSFGLYRMASIVNRKVDGRSYRHQRKGDT